MKKVLNFVLNQLGLIVVVVAGALLYYDRVDFTWSFAVITGVVLMMILVASKLTHKSLKRELKGK